MQKTNGDQDGGQIAMKRNVKLLMLSVLLAAMAYGQESQSKALAYSADKANVPDAIAKVKSGHFALVHVDMIAKAGAVEAVPILEEQFSRSQDPLVKAKIASALVKLGDKDDIYWDFLAKQASSALESDAPDFMNFDSQSNTAAGPSAEFVAWAKAHNVSPESAGNDSIYWLPGKVLLLGLSGDPRAIPLLRRALLSPNHMIENAAATGLAELQDKDSIPFIIDACKKAPPAAAALIAESLIYFDDAEAKKAVDTYVTEGRAKTLREARAQGKRTPLSY
jgi:HEAT repeat protein